MRSPNSHQPTVDHLRELSYGIQKFERLAIAENIEHLELPTVKSVTLTVKLPPGKRFTEDF